MSTHTTESTYLTLFFNSLFYPCSPVYMIFEIDSNKIVDSLPHCRIKLTVKLMEFYERGSRNESIRMYCVQG